MWLPLDWHRRRVLNSGQTKEKNNRHNQDRAQQPLKPSFAALHQHNTGSSRTENSPGIVFILTQRPLKRQKLEALLLAKSPGQGERIQPAIAFEAASRTLGDS
jgi:hypothetical protein